MDSALFLQWVDCIAIAGAGIAILDERYVRTQIMSGDLVRALEDWDLPTLPIWAVFPGRRLMPSRTRVFLDALEAGLAL